MLDWLALAPLSLASSDSQEAVPVEAAYAVPSASELLAPWPEEVLDARGPIASTPLPGGQFDVHGAAGSARFAVAPGARRVARTVTVEGGVVVEQGGERGPLFHSIDTRTGLLFSEDGARLAYIGVRAGKHHVVLDGQEGPPLMRVYEIGFHPVSGRLLATGMELDEANRKSTLVAFVDGEEVMRAQHIPGYAWSPDGSRLALHTVQQTEQGVCTALVCGELEIPNVKAFAFGPSGTVTAIAGERHELFVHLEDTRSGPYGAADLPAFATETDAHAFRFRPLELSPGTGQPPGLPCVVQFGVQTYRGQSSPSEREPALVRVSPSGARVAFVSYVGPREQVIVDGEPGPEYDQVLHLAFDGETPVYVGTRDGKSVVVRDGEPYDDRAGRMVLLSVSPDPSRFALFVVGDDRIGRVVTERGPHEVTGTLVVSSVAWSPDGSRLAYQVQPYSDPEESSWLVVDGERVQAVGGPDTLSHLVVPLFSQDGRSVACMRRGTIEQADAHDRMVNVPAVELWADGEPRGAVPGQQVMAPAVTDDGHVLCWVPEPRVRGEPYGGRHQLHLDGRPVTPLHRLALQPPAFTPDSGFYLGTLDAPHPATGGVTEDGAFEFLEVSGGELRHVRYAIDALLAAG